MENKGQLMDQNKMAVPSVLYLASSGDLHIQLRKDGFSYDVFDHCERPRVNGINAFCGLDSTMISEVNTHRVDVTFKNCNVNSTITASEQIESTYHYYTTGTGDAGAIHVRKFGRVLYENVYEGIDILFQMNQGARFEYDIILHPGADISLVKFLYEGQREISVSEYKVKLKLAFNELEENIPFSYHSKSGAPLCIQYSHCGNEVSFHTHENIDDGAVIDPIPNLIYASLFGGSGNDRVFDSKVMDNGDLIIYGLTSSTDIIATSGAFQSVIGSPNQPDVFIQKWSSNNQLLWSTYFGGSASESAGRMHASESQGITITGATASSNQIASSGVYQSTIGGDSDAFLARFNLDGIRLWSTYYGGSQFDSFNSHVVSGDVITCVGSSLSANFPITVDALQGTQQGLGDAVLVKWSMNGTPSYSTYLGSANDDKFLLVDIASNGNTYVSGSTKSVSGIQFNAFQSAYGGGFNDGWLACFDPTMNLIFSSYFGGTLEESIIDIELLSDGNFAICGFTHSTSNMVTDAAYKTVPEALDGFVSIFSSGGMLLYSTYFGGERDEFITSIKQESGQIMIAGMTNSISQISTFNAHQESLHDPLLTNNDANDGFIASLSADLSTLNWGSYFGNYKFDAVQSLSISNGELIALGQSNSTSDLPINQQSSFVTSNAFQQNNNGAGDIFIAKFNNFLEVNSPEMLSAMVIFPNPAKEVLKVHLPLLDDWSFLIYDGNGKIVATNSRRHIQSDSMDIHHLQTGVYQFVAIASTGVMYRHRFFKD